MQHTKGRLGESLEKKKLDSKVMHSEYIRSTDSLLVKKTRSYVCRGGGGGGL